MKGRTDVTQDEVYEDLDKSLRELIEGYTLSEVLERIGAVARALPKAPDHTCPSGTVFSDREFHEGIAAELERLAA